MNGVRRSGLSLAELVAFWLAQLLVGVTGVALLVLRLSPPPEDAFAAVAPSFPFWQHAHVLAAPILVFFLGLLWARHASPFLRARRPRRLSGVALLLLALVMVASGYGLQVSVEEALRQSFRWLHTIAGLAWLATAGLHLLGRRATNGGQSANGQNGACPPAPKVPILPYRGRS
ncbi:hypothetical protein EG19_03625 [Thermoanaerobaculum aquaticum]|uniref:DUF4405 domain-containing protein n=1 Tax=Thermoanaerobaculum aquaticum TaxID=1312852 RepID=A0A062Y3E0_9BACT|nr:hypothetical protein [Thermoanaerobaculum aquaticum]KDA54901.1 hypothetical protein EG19_03625 [Thermoanaerobaculum aquaticum]